MDNEKVYNMKFARIYDALVKKAERKGRTKEEVDTLIRWLCGYDQQGIQELLDHDVDYKTFLMDCPAWNPDSSLIKGSICGIRVENITDPVMRRIRCLDKIVDELAKGKSLEKITNRR